MYGEDYGSLSSVASSAHEGTLDLPRWRIIAAWVAVAWYFILMAVCYLGWIQIYRFWTSTPEKSRSCSGEIPAKELPHITIIRPVKGLEPHLYECMASTFDQDYPQDKITHHLCVESTRDPAYQILRQLQHDFPDRNVRIFIESDGKRDELLGPNPKVRNMSRAYHEATGDFIWIVDCNAWLAKGNCGRMVDKLCGWGPGDKGVKCKFVHNLPLVVATDEIASGNNTDAQKSQTVPFFSEYGEVLSLGSSHKPKPVSLGKVLRTAWDNAGGRLEELFFASAHGKMYTAINTVLVAPCIVGKSTMFRKEHLDYLTKTAPATKGPRRGVGIDYFSYNICEDHLIGDILWKHKVPEEVKGERWHKHSLIWGDLAFQPASHMSVRAYVNRRVRWLRVRKFTVLAATLVEPNTESIVASLELAFGATTLLPRFLPQYHDILSSWTAFAMTWFCSMLVWLMTDWALYALLHSCTCVEADDDTPLFARPRKVSNTSTRRPFYQWLAAWIGREVLALPIWLWAVCFGSTVVWRDRKFKVGFDTFVREIEGGEMGSSQGGGGIRDARAFHHVSAFAENNSRCVKRRLPR